MAKRVTYPCHRLWRVDAATDEETTASSAATAG
jgi:hypothetical protein